MPLGGSKTQTVKYRAGRRWSVLVRSKTLQSQFRKKKLVENYLQDKKVSSVKNQTSFQVILLLKHMK